MIPLPEVKAWLGIAASVTVYDDLLTQAESDAVAVANRLIGFYFGAPEVRTYVRCGTGTTEMWAPEHIADVDGPYQPLAVTRQLYEGDPNAELIDPAADNGYVVRGRRLRRKGGHLWDPWSEYVLSFEAGYLPGEEPGDVRRLVLAILSVWWNRRGTEGGIQSEAIGGYSYSLAAVSDAVLLGDPIVSAIVGARRRQRA